MMDGDGRYGVACHEGAAHQDDSRGCLGPITGLLNAMQVVNWCCPSLEGRRFNQMSWEFSGPTHLLRVGAAVLCARGSIERLGFAQWDFSQESPVSNKLDFGGSFAVVYKIHFGHAQTQGLVREGEC
jgi:hypothetical protein